MSEFEDNEEQGPRTERKVKTVTIYRRCSSEGNGSSDPNLFADDQEMKLPPMNQPSHTASTPLPPRCSSAADAEKETIFCLKRECKALKMAMRALPKHSKEWTMMNAKLEIAKEELQATLEDVDMTQNYSNNFTEAGEMSLKVPTPPLSSPFSLTPVKSFNRQGSSYSSDTDSSMEINELFASLRPPRLDTNEKSNVDLEALKQELDKAEKYSLEYFKIKKKIDRAENRSSSGSPSSISSGRYSVESLGPPPSLKSFDEGLDEPGETEDTTHLQYLAPETNAAAQSHKTEKSGSNAAPSTPSQQPIKVSNGLGNLVELLDVVPKYSLEWFNLKKDIKNASGGQAPRTPKLTKHRSSFSISGRSSSVPKDQMKRLDSPEVKYPIPHVEDSDVRKPTSRRRSSSRETTRRRTRSQDIQGFDSLDAQYFYVRMRRNVITVQNLWRGRSDRIKFNRIRSAALCIQSTFRMTLRRNLYRQVIYGVIFIQSCWRGHIQRVHLRIVASPFVNAQHAHYVYASDHSASHEEPSALSATPSEDEEDFYRIQKSIEAMKNEKMSMEMKLLQLKNDIDVIKNEKLRQDLDRMRHDIELLEHLNEDVLFDNAAIGSVYSFDQTLESVPTNVFSVVLEQKGSLGIEMEHHKSSDSVRIAHVKKRSQADRAGLEKGDIVVNFRSQQHPDGMPYAQFIALAKQGVRPLVLDITRVDPSVVGSSRRSGFFRKKKQR
jgi:hypothetical protein